MKGHFIRGACGAVVCAFAISSVVSGQAAPAVPAEPGAGRGTAAGAPLPPGYVIGAEDLLTIVFWRDRDMSADVVVRPDGKISLPLLNDLQAAGRTPDELKALLEKVASKYVAEPNATVIVKEIRSRKVFLIGEVARPGTIALTGDMNVLQAIAVAGGLLEYADRENITVIRNENERERRFRFNYNDVVKGKKTQQNIMLKPGDTIVVR